MSNAKEIKSLVNKIIKARKIQKDRIEQGEETRFTEEESIKKIQKPVVEEVSKQAKSTIRALENQQRQLQQITNIAPPIVAPPAVTQVQVPVLAQTGARPKVTKTPKKEHVEKHSPTMQTSKPQKYKSVSDVTDPDDVIEWDDPNYVPTKHEQLFENFKTVPQYVQVFYRKYRQQRKHKATDLELDFTDGSLGEDGKVDVLELYNKGNLNITTPGGYISIPAKKMTPGLLALLTLPFMDLKESGIKPTARDRLKYFDTMYECGIPKHSSTGTKYKIYIKPGLTKTKKIIRERLEKEIEDEEALQETQGKGVFVYKEPKELQDRLSMLVGSIEAGNNNQEIKSEMRSILNKLQEEHNIPDCLHKKFFCKFHL